MLVMEEGKFKKIFKKIFNVFKVAFIIILVYFGIFVFITYNKNINQGNFRVLDFIISSTAEFENTNDYTGEWSYNISQNNILSILISSNDVHSINAKLEDIECSNENIEIFQTGYEASKTKIKNKPSLRLVSNVLENGTILYEIEIRNSNVLKEYNLPPDITEITHDSTIFNIANVSIKDLLFDVSFKFVMVDSNQNISSFNVKLNLPIGNICENGNIVERQDTAKYIFRLAKLNNLKNKL